VHWDQLDKAHHFGVQIATRAMDLKTVRTAGEKLRVEFPNEQLDQLLLQRV
jgi:hypothetical protein